MWFESAAKMRRFFVGPQRHWSDLAIDLVRQHLWLASEDFSLSVGDYDTRESHIAMYHRMVDSLIFSV